MEKAYTEIAGRSVERINALSDGLFAIAMTLIVLDIHVPGRLVVHSEAELLNAIGALAPEFVTYATSFLTLGIFWIGQQSQLNHLREADRYLSWIQLTFLAAVATLPFTTHLLADFITFRVALLVYWANILTIGLLLLASWAYAERAGLVVEDGPPGLSRAILRRIVIAQLTYAAGAALCFVSTYLSLAVIGALQVYYAIGPAGLGRRPAG